MKNKQNNNTVNLTPDEEINVKSVHDLDIEIYSLEKILKLKKERLMEKIKALNPNEFYIYNEEKNQRKEIN